MRKNDRIKANKIKLAQPDRSGPTEKTLLDMAQDRNLFDEADRLQARIRKKKARESKQEGAEEEDDADDDEDEGDGKLDPSVEHGMDTFLWSISLAMLHFTLDVLVQHQYAMEILWSQIVWRSIGSVVVFAFLIFVLHNHPGNTFLFGIPIRWQSAVRQTVLFTGSVTVGCYLIFITNKRGYLHVMKQAPALGCLWVWTVIEMNLSLAVFSLGIEGLYLWWAGLDLF